MRLTFKNIMSGLLLVSLAAMIYSCAVITRPEGGDDDEIGPMILIEESTKNFQTNFIPEKVELKFDEWIQLSNPVKEVFISPPLDYPLQIQERGKVLTLKFNEAEELKANTTYQINLGKSVVDYTARNPIENYSFVFSTGPVIDSLSTAGIVREEGTNKPLADVLVMLYSNLSDTAILSLKPDYISRTNKLGAFRIENLRADTFQVFGLQDENVSFTYDQESEKIAFSDSLLIIEDTLINNLQLLLFDEEDKLRMLEATQKESGLIKFGFNRKPETPLKVVYLKDSLENALQEMQGDTLYYWHTDLEAKKAQLLIEGLESTDTIRVKSGKASVLDLKLIPQDNDWILFPKDSVIINWSKPIQEVDTSLINMSDTMGTFNLLSYKIDGRQLNLEYSLKSGNNYKLKLDSSAIKDWYGVVSDSIDINLKVLTAEDLGKIKLNFINTDSTQYLISFLKGSKAQNSFVISNDKEIIIENLKSGSYKLIITEDSNRDNRWTAGSLKRKSLPEAKKEYNLEELKSGWELDTDVNLQQLFNGTEGK